MLARQRSHGNARPAIVSPVLTDSDDDGDGDSSQQQAHKRASVVDLERGEPAESESEPQLQSKLQRKPDDEAVEAAGADGSSWPSSSNQTSLWSQLTSLGHKQQWRKARSRRRQQTASVAVAAAVGSVDDHDQDEDQQHDQDQDHDRAPSTSRIDSGSPSDGSAWSCSIRDGASSASLSRASDNGITGSSDSKRTSSPSAPPRARAVVTRQKDKFAARLCLPNQKPLYLGRYRTQEIAMQICEQALTAVATPRK